MDKWNLDGVSVDTQDNMTVTGNLTVTGTTTITSGITQTVSEYALTGAIDPTDSFVSLDGTTSGSMTLAAGADGHQMTVICINSDNTVDIDADFGGATATATFTVGDGMTMISQDSVWYITGNNGVVLT
jgi:hypothetical protein